MGGVWGTLIPQKAFVHLSRTIFRSQLRFKGRQKKLPAFKTKVCLVLCCTWFHYRGFFILVFVRETLGFKAMIFSLLFHMLILLKNISHIIDILFFTIVDLLSLNLHVSIILSYLILSYLILSYLILS